MESLKKTCQLHIHISMEDRPGILAETLESIVRCEWNILDIKQFVFNGLLNLSIFLDGNDSDAVVRHVSSIARRKEDGCDRGNVSR